MTNNRAFLYSVCSGVALAAALGWSSAASAQTTVDEVIVTAQKRSENIQNVPAAISVVDAKLLNNLHATSLTDYAAYVPDFHVISQGGPGQTELILRGISPQGAGAATVGTYIDDTPLGSSSAYSRSASYSLDLLPYDVQRVEVLSGPQGTLYGSSALSGLLKYVLVQPSLDQPQFRVGADLFGVAGANGVGDSLRAQINTPLVTDKLGFLASYDNEYTPSYIHDVQTGSDDVNGTREQSGRLALRWDATNDLTVHLGALIQQIDSDGNGTVALSPTTLQPLYGERTDDAYIAQPFQSQIQYYSATVNWHQSWADLTSATSYSTSNLQQTFDDTRTYGVLLPLFGQPLAITPFDLGLRLKKWTEEVRIASPTGSRLEWLGGVFYTHESSSNSQTVPAFNLATGAPLAAPYNVIAALQLPSTYQEYAFFGNATYHFTDMFDLSAGVRYSHNNQTFAQIDSGPLVGVSNTPGSSSGGVVTYSVSPELHLSKQVMLYARVATGYRPGGPNFALPGVPSSFNADQLINYEGGIKSQFWQNRITLDADYFYVDWTDIQVSVANPAGISYFANGGRATSQGIEANAALRLDDGLSFAGTFSYTDAVLAQTSAAIGGRAGDVLPYVPRFSGSLQANYTRSLGPDWTGHLGAGLRLQGQVYTAVESSFQAFRLPAYGALDLDADITHGPYTIKLFIKNATNQIAYGFGGPDFSGLTGQVTQVEGTLIQPRTIGLSLDVKM